LFKLFIRWVPANLTNKRCEVREILYARAEVFREDLASVTNWTPLAMVPGLEVIRDGRLKNRRHMVIELGLGEVGCLHTVREHRLDDGSEKPFGPGEQLPR
jgi:hypothetical protein